MVGLELRRRLHRPTASADTDTSLELYVDHLDYLVAHLGIDRVGGSESRRPHHTASAIGDVTGQPKLLAAIAARGYDEPRSARCPGELAAGAA